MNKEAADVIKSIADKLDVPVEQLWNGLIAYAPFYHAQWEVQMILSVVGFVVAAVAIFIGLYMLVKHGEEIGGGVAFFGAIALIPVCISLTVNLGDMANAMAAKHAPQAWAAKQILNKVTR